MVKTKTETIVDNAKRINDELYKLGRNAYLVSLGAFAMAEEEARGLYDRMLARGETFEKSGSNPIGRFTEKAKELGQTVEHRVQETVSSSLNRAGVPSRDEIRTLIQRVEQLTLKVEKLSATH